MGKIVGYLQKHTLENFHCPTGVGVAHSQLQAEAAWQPA